ncbi:uncharacterized protein J3D65DRAFT_633329 [Phyllosticta citribraziliensis]|uniref:Uncharacterized protein n=1 Tax=Phyllosticta citribraziliensis TaxID=989973 RepID=A0ABR1LC26_9PEZI
MDAQPPRRDHGADMLRLFNEIRGKLDEANATLVSHMGWLAALAKHEQSLHVARPPRQGLPDISTTVEAAVSALRDHQRELSTVGDPSDTFTNVLAHQRQSLQNRFTASMRASRVAATQSLQTVRAPRPLLTNEVSARVQTAANTLNAHRQQQAESTISDAANDLPGFTRAVFNREMARRAHHEITSTPRASLAAPGPLPRHARRGGPRFRNWMTTLDTIRQSPRIAALPPNRAVFTQGELAYLRSMDIAVATATRTINEMAQVVQELDVRLTALATKSVAVERKLRDYHGRHGIHRGSP